MFSKEQWAAQSGRLLLSTADALSGEAIDATRRFIERAAVLSDTPCPGEVDSLPDWLMATRGLFRAIAPVLEPHTLPWIKTFVELAEEDFYKVTAAA